MKPTHTYLILALLLFFFYSCKNDNSTGSIGKEFSEETTSKFTLLSPSRTNITFVNQLNEGLNTNVLMYEYFYNGGGVATGDLNGDDLIDIYFTSNMGENKLYLNKGKLRFEEITRTSKAGGRSGPWKTGVTLVDINGDGRLDIYLCYSGALPDVKRANQLFINQGNDSDNIPIFKEEAAKYGLDSKGFSNQGYFFDYDRDGDLDMLLLNHNPKSLPVLNEAMTRKMMVEDDPFRGLRLFRQDNGVFSDITTITGITGSGLSYGLGIGIADINNDGWPDFYLSNDYTIPDYLYINNQDGTFTDKLQESVAYNSHFSMGNDIADMNNDGLADIITLDMLPEDNERQKLLMAPDNYSKFDLNVRSGFHYQYMRNMLQLNNGNGTFSEVGQLTGMSKTDWSWAALAADYNNDGRKDLYVTNGYHRDYTNLDFINYMNDFTQKKGRLQREDVLEIISNMPASDVVNYMFSNEPVGQEGQNLTFENKTKEWGLHYIGNSNGAAYADLDNDGDLDLVVNNINKSAFIFQNESRQNEDSHFLQIKLKGEDLNTQGIGAQVTIFYQDKKQKAEQYTSRGYLSTVSPILHFGLGENKKIDSLIILWQSGKSEKLENVNADQVITLREKSASEKTKTTRNEGTIFTKTSSPIDFSNNQPFIRDFNRQFLLLRDYSHQSPCMAKGDLNGDGLEDIFIGGSVGKAAGIFIQKEGQRFQLKENNIFITDRNSEDTDAAIFDANGDGNLDIYVTSGGYHDFNTSSPELQDRLYINDGKGNFTKKRNVLPENYTSNSTIAVNDINADGYPDIFVGARVIPGRYPEIPASALLVNDGKGNFTNQIKSIAPDLENFGMITDAVWIDLNTDNQKDLIVVGEWTKLSVFISKDGKLEDQTAQYFDKKYKGWWNTIAIADVNKDQKPDLLLGNMGTNTTFQASEKEPLEMYYKDFDNNGSVDPVFCYYLQGKSYPHASRDELVKQLPAVRSKFTDYKSYANATLDDIFSKEDLSDAGYLNANYLKTTLFLSTPEGKFQQKKLPEEAQYAPIHAIQFLDYNGDGNEDVLLCGNNSHMAIRLGSMEANYGKLLRGDGTGNFTYIPQSLSGFDIRGDVKDILQIGNTLFFGINEGKVATYMNTN